MQSSSASNKQRLRPRLGQQAPQVPVEEAPLARTQTSYSGRNGIKVPPEVDGNRSQRRKSKGNKSKGNKSKPSITASSLTNEPLRGSSGFDLENLTFTGRNNRPRSRYAQRLDRIKLLQDKTRHTLDLANSYINSSKIFQDARLRSKYTHGRNELRQPNRYYQMRREQKEYPIRDFESNHNKNGDIVSKKRTLSAKRIAKAGNPRSSEVKEVN